MAPREDLNPRVQWTVDFESTAIPELAISAQSSTSESEIRMTGFHGLMQVEVRSAEGVMTVESEVPISVGGVLDKLGIAHSTVLAVVGDTIIPHTSMISDDVSIELVVVSSGG